MSGLKEIRESIASAMKTPDRTLLESIRRESWTSHNIPLTESTSTLGDGKPLIGNDLRMQSIKSNARRFLGRDLSALRCLDLACLEGGMSFEMAREGMDVIGVEGNESNYLKCRLIEDYFALPNLRFRKGDVKELNPSRMGRFDLILCCGILYHFDNPFSFMATLFDLLRDSGLIFLDTCFAPAEDALEACKFKGVLSEIVIFEYGGRRYEGRWYEEYDEKRPETAGPWNAISNEKSFWPTHESLIRALYHRGFRYVLEILGWELGSYQIEDLYRLRHEYSRSHFLVMKAPSCPSRSKPVP